MSAPARLYMSPPHLTGNEEAYIREVLDSNWVAPVGPHLERFERAFAQYVGVQAAVAVTTGTAALHLGLRLAGVQAGDEVLCSTFTFCASANPIVYQGARPVFLDSDAHTWNLDPNLLEEELRWCDQHHRRPKALVLVHILGQSADLDPILEIARRYELPVIEDAAEALGARYRDRMVGGDGRCSAFSFNGNKIITTSGGGMLCSNDPKIVEQARYLATQARDPGPFYYHQEVGHNYRLSNVLAAIGLAQLEMLDQRIGRRREIRRLYAEQLADLPGISWMPEAPYGASNAWLTVMQVDPEILGISCEDIRLALEEENIESRRVWVPLHRQPAFSGCRFRGGDVAESLFQTALCLPSGSAMTDADVRRVCDRIRQAAQATAGPSRV